MSHISRAQQPRVASGSHSDGAELEHHLITENSGEQSCHSSDQGKNFWLWNWVFQDLKEKYISLGPPVKEVTSVIFELLIQEKT